MITAMESESMTGYTRYLKLNKLDDITVAKAKKIFWEYVSRGIVIEGTFSDDDWMLNNEKHHTGRHFKVDRKEYDNNSVSEWTGCTADNFIECIKAYTVFQFGLIELSSLQCLVNDLCKLPGLAVDTWAGSMDMQGYLEGFLEMLPGEVPAKDMLIERIHEIGYVQTRKTGPRKLADFSCFLAFGRAMTDAWAEMKKDRKLYFFPVYMWWNLTSILPLRVTEFLLTPRDCLTCDGKGWKLTIRRTKLKKGMDRIKYKISEDYKEHRYEIPEKMAADIQWYIRSTKDMSQAELGTLFIPDENKSQGYMGYYSMQLRLRNFCRRYMRDESYPIHLGDTRHLAMINLMLSGGSPVICRELAGHESVDVSSNYYANLSGVVESIVYDHYHRGKGDAELGGTMRFPVATGKDLIRVRDGYCDCTSVGKGDYTECAKSFNSQSGLGDCRYCTHYLPDDKGLFMEIKTQRKDEVDDDSGFLMRMIEIVRKGKGCTEDIAAALARLQSSAYRYAKIYNSFLEMEDK